jgi:hypothetical protein
MTQHHGKQQKDNNNGKDLHYQMNKWPEDEQRMGWWYKDEAQAQMACIYALFGPQVSFL